MNISYKWLKEYVDFELTPQEVCDALTSTGLEVDALEEVQSIRGGLKGLYVGKVLTCDIHPNSDHLHVTTVDLGHETPSQICIQSADFLCESPLILNLLYGGVGKFVFAGFTAAAELLPDGGHGKTDGNDGRKLVDAFVSGQSERHGMKESYLETSSLGAILAYGSRSSRD